MAKSNILYTPRDREWHPKPDYPEYRSTIFRSPKQELVIVPDMMADKTGPAFGHNLLGDLDNNMILNFGASDKKAIGEQIIVHGKVIDENGKPVPNTLVEVWQANAGGRYRHKNDNYQAPLDPNFGGCGRCVTDAQGNYSFRTVKPGPYPWPNGVNDWRPAHIHFSIFGSGFSQRLISQMYFEGDPHIKICPIINTISDPRAVDQLTARLDMSKAIPLDILAYRFDIAIRGTNSTYFENKPEGN